MQQNISTGFQTQIPFSRNRPNFFKKQNVNFPSISFRKIWGKDWNFQLTSWSSALPDTKFKKRSTRKRHSQQFFLNIKYKNLPMIFKIKQHNKVNMFRKSEIYHWDRKIQLWQKMSVQRKPHDSSWWKRMKHSFILLVLMNRAGLQLNTKLWRVVMKRNYAVSFAAWKADFINLKKWRIFTHFLFKYSSWCFRFAMSQF